MNRREKIIDISYRNFVLNGYKDTSLQKIAEEIGITKPAFYYHFKNKKELYFEVIKFFNEKRINESIHVLDSSKPSKDRVKQLFLNFINTTYEKNSEDRQSYYYFVIDAIHHFPELREELLGTANPFVKKMFEIISDGIEKGEIRADLDIQAVMFHIGVMIEGLSTISAMVPNIDMDIFNRYFEMFWNLIRKDHK